MDEEELTQLQEAYRKLGQPLPPSLQDELELRALFKRLKELDDLPSQETAGASCPARLPDNPVANQKEPDHLSASSMNRRQTTCLKAGLLLLIMATIFPPWRYSGAIGGFRYSRSLYGFLFHPPIEGATVNLSRLVVEWVLISLVTSAAFFALAQQARSTTGQEFSPQHSGKLWQRTVRVPFAVVVALVAMGFTWYGYRRVTRTLPPTEVSKILVQQGYINDYGLMELDIYNGSEFVLTEIRISVSVYDEKGNAVISNRVYRIPAYDCYPQQSKKLQVDVGFSVAQNQRWVWLTVGARGRPE